MVPIFLKNILAEAKLYSYTIDEVLEQFLKFEGKTLLFIDTELTGLEPNVSYIQLTQISAMVVDGSTMEVLETFDERIKLTNRMENLLNDPKSREAIGFDKANQRSLRKYKKPIDHPREILKKTHYYDKPAKIDEPTALKMLDELITKYPSALVVAHNATFDMKALQARRKRYGLPPLPRVPVLDTVKVSRFFLIPALTSLQNNEEATRLLAGLLAKTKYVSYSSSLGRLAHVFGLEMENWHDAEADVRMLMGILQKIIEFLKKNRGLDIRKSQGLQARRLRRMK